MAANSYYVIPLFGAALLLILLAPSVDKELVGSERPGVFTYAGVGLGFTFIAACTAYLLYSGISAEKAFVGAAVGFSALVAFTKFVLSPLALYRANSFQVFDCLIYDAPMGLAVVALGVFVIYALFVGIANFFYSRSVSAALPGQQTKGRLGMIAIAVAVVLVLLAVIAATTNEQASVMLMFWSLLTLSASADYISKVLVSSGIGWLLGAALAGAFLLMVFAYSKIADESIRLRNIGLISAFFGTTMLLLVAYSALWLVYAVVLTTLWPLRTVGPK